MRRLIYPQACAKEAALRGPYSGQPVMSRSAVRVRSSAPSNRLRNRNTRIRSDTWEQVPADCGAKTFAGSSAVGHPMIRTLNVPMQRLLRLDSPVL